MRGLPLLLPVLSCFFAAGAYATGGGVWPTLAAFFLGGPIATVIIALLLRGSRDDSRDSLTGKNRN